MKFYICEHCGNIITHLTESGIVVSCCGQKMRELGPDANGAYEKHMPVITFDEDKVIVEVGSVEHPMVEGHHIEWIIIETTKGHQCVKLSPEDKPRAEFKLMNGAEFIAAYEYCNLHGLWKK